MTALKVRTTTVVLFQGDDLDPIEALRQKAAEAGVRHENAHRLAENQAAAPRRVSEGAETLDELKAASTSLTAAAKAYDDFMVEATERGESVELQAVGRKRWRDLLKAHPPRKHTIVGPDGVPTEVDDDVDGMWGFNYETLCDELVPESVVDKAKYTAEWLDALSDGDWSKLYSSAVNLNQGSGPDPKARLSSRIAQTSDGNSKPPARLA